MQQRQLRLGDILDDYCPRERRVTNHAVVAMIGTDVKQTRCTTCDAEHEYKHAKVPRQRRKAESPGALYSQVLASGPKRASTEAVPSNGSAQRTSDVEEPMSVIDQHEGHPESQPHHHEQHQQPHIDAMPAPSNEPPSTPAQSAAPPEHVAGTATPDDVGDAESDTDLESGGALEDDGPVHRPLIRASLPRPEGQPPQTRPMPEFTIRQPGGRPNRFRPRHQRGGQQGGQFQGNRANGNFGGGAPRGGMPRHGGGNRPPMMKRHGGSGRNKRSK
jgi:hypothetical protein